MTLRAATAGLALAMALGACSRSDTAEGTGAARTRPLADGMSCVLVTLDTTRADFLSCLGGPPGTTPRIDALAARSALFTSATSESNVTNPSHVSVMTGLRAIEHGVLSNGVTVPEGTDTLADAFRRAGYRTAAFVATRHLGPELRWSGFLTFPAVASELEAAEVTDRALSWLARSARERFFLWIHYWDPHAPYEPPEDLRRSFYSGDPTAGEGPPIAQQPFFRQATFAGVGERLAGWLGDVRDPAWPRAMYAAELRDADRHLGRLLDALEAAGVARSTVVVVVGDHGESLDEHGIYYSHVGLYEQQLRVPLVVHVPGLAPVTSDLPVWTLDVAPTVVELFGLELAHAMSGLSLVPLVAGRTAPELEARGPFVHQSGSNQALAVRDGPWKLVWPVTRSHPVLSGEPQLFHLGRDPGEQENLAASEPRRVEALRELIAPWIALGVVPATASPDLPPEAVQALQRLGYLGD